MAANPSESTVLRTWLETMLELPWNKKSEDCTDLKFAKQILDEDHYGLDKVKERVLEFLAVRHMTEGGESPILCLAGPPGTGKNQYCPVGGPGAEQEVCADQPGRRPR